MIRSIVSLMQTDSASARRLARLKHVLMTAAVLSFALVVPSANAACGGNNLARGTAALPRAVHSEAAGELLGPGRIGDPSIVGLWNITFTSGGEVVDVAFDVWHADQTEVLNDYTPPAEGNVCLGVWEQVGVTTYRLKHPSWSFDASGNLLGTVVISETVKLASDGNSFSGPYTYDIYDVAGNFVEEFTGTVKATRIRAM
jgi:hypothetical protein